MIQRCFITSLNIQKSSKPFMISIWRQNLKDYWQKKQSIFHYLSKDPTRMALPLWTLQFESIGLDRSEQCSCYFKRFQLTFVSPERCFTSCQNWSFRALSLITYSLTTLFSSHQSCKNCFKFNGQTIWRASFSRLTPLWFLSKISRKF